MVLWDKIVIGSNLKNGRNSSDSQPMVNNDRKYMVSTVAAIETNEVTREPSVSASIQHSFLCVTIDNSIIIFENETCENILFNYNCDSLITCYTMSKDKKLLFVVTKSRTLHCFNLQIKDAVCFQIDCFDSKHSYGYNDSTIIKICLDVNGIDIFVVACNGGTYRFANLLETLSEDLHSLHLEEISAKLDTYFLEQARGFDTNEVQCVAEIKHTELALLSENPQMLFLWPSRKNINLSTMPYKYEKIQFLKHSMAMICLRTDNKLSMVCSQTLLGLDVYDNSVIDFTVIDSEKNNDTQIIVLTKPIHRQNICDLLILSVPGFKQQLEIQVSNPVFLVENLGIHNDIIYLEGIKNSAGIIQTILIQTLRQNNQSLESTYYAQALRLSSRLNCLFDCSIEHEALNEHFKETNLTNFIEALDKIQNVQNLINCCQRTILPDCKQMKRLYLYIRRRILQHNVSNNRNVVQWDFVSNINSTLEKLETFEMIHSIELNDENLKSQAMAEWIRFSQGNLLEECENQLRKGSLEAAALIWTRHPSIMNNISVDTLQDFLDSIPDLPIKLLLVWLSHFISSSVYMLPDAVNSIISWGCKKIKFLETTHLIDWPDIGLSFATNFLELLNYEKGLFSPGNRQIFISQNSYLQQFLLLVQALSDLCDLKAHYKIVVSLRIYLSDPLEVTHLLLDEVDIDKIPDLINQFLKQYMLKHSLQNDKVLSSYIERVLKNFGNQTSLEKSSWEQRIATVIDFIYNIEIRLQRILDVLRRVPVPWSAIIKSLVDSVSTLDHELAYEIKNEYNSVPIKLILKKYGYERIGVTEKLFRLIIKMNRSEMIDDIDKLTKDDPLLKRAVVSMIISNCLLIGNLDAIIKILNSSEDNDVLFCVERIANNISGLLSLENIPPYIEHYMEILNWVKNKFQNISMKTNINSYYCRTILDHIEDVKSMYRLKKFFNISATFTDFGTKKDAILENYVHTLCNGIEKQNVPILTLYHNVTKVAKLLKLPKKHAISLLLNVTDNIDTLTEFITARQADLIVAAEECGSIKELCAAILQNPRVNANIVSVMNVMSARAINSCSNEVLNSNLSLSSIWSNLYCEIGNRQALDSANKKKGASRKKWKLYSIYADMAILLDDSLFCVLKDSLIVKLLNQGDYSLDLQKMLDMYKVLHVNDLITELLNRSQLVQIDHNEYSLLQVVKTLHYCSCMSFTIDEVAKAGVVSYLRKIAIALLRKLVRTKSLDLQLGLCCLFMLPEEEARTWLSDTCKLLQANYSAHSATVTLGYEYFRLTKNEHLIQPFIYNKMVHHWAHKLANYSITYKELLLSDIASKKQILERIMSFKNDNVLSLVQDYCTHFGFSKDESLLLTYLKTLIKTWNPTWTISSLKGRRELCINQDEVAKLTKKCKDVISLIKNKESLVQCIDTLSSEVNFYYYEVFLLLMDISNEKNSDKRNYLHFLQKYIRKGCPTEIEGDAWRRLNIEGTALPSIAEWRLPFLPEIDVWKFIAPELDLKTYVQWLDIAPVLKLQSNIICALAIKQEAHKIWANVQEKGKNNQWNLCQRNTSWLTDIKTCMERMTGPDSLYYGTAALYYVVNHTPPGADQVAAARECYICAQRAAITCTMFKDELMDKIKSKYLRFTCEHILRTHDLGKEKYMKLTMNPNALMRELYMDDSIVLRYKTTTYQPDINSAVDALSKLFSTNLVKLRLELLHEWLQPDLKYGDIDQSVTETVRVVRTSDNNGIHDDNLLRACYMLQHGDIELSANFLIDIIFGDNNRMSRTHEERYRALYVLQSITSPEKLQDLTKRDLNYIKQHFTSLKYLSKLDSWGFEVSIETFQTCSKYDLVETILKIHGSSPQALTWLAQMCIDFKLHQYTLWDKILTEMTILQMVSELKNILLETRDISVIVSCNGYIAGWQTIIDEPFKKMDTEPSSEQIDECVNILRVLHSCAVVHELQYTNILESCFQCNQAHLALSLIPFLRGNDKQYVLERICLSPYVRKIAEDLIALTPKGILTVPQSITMLKEAISTINTDKAYTLYGITPNLR